MNQNKITIAQNHALVMKGQCLSPEYISSVHKLKWLCEKGHEWESIFNNIVKKNQWCPNCRGGKNLTNKDKLDKLNQAKRYAESKNGQCLSTEFVNSKIKMKWKCSSGHREWESTWYSAVKNDRWCTECANENIKGKYRKLQNGLGIAKKYAEAKGGQCLSTEYINYDEKMEFNCHNNQHKPFFTNLDSLLCKGTWCPECIGLNQQEFRTRNLLNYLLDTDFVKTKAVWNINPETGRLLELDGYSKELNMAFEYQGKQHFKQIYSESLEVIQNRDLIKAHNCLKNKVKLIYIYEKNKTRKNSLFFLEDVLNELNNNEISIKKEIDMKIVEGIFMNCQNTTIQQEFSNKAKEYAKSKNGFLLSEYIDSKAKMEWKCAKNHLFERDYEHSVYRDRWCPECDEEQKKKIRLNEVLTYSESKGGECLSTEYVSSTTAMKLKCSNNHIFSQNFDSLINKSMWCPQCSEAERLNKYLIQAKQYAENKDGKCLSNEFVNAKTRMLWTCVNNHIFEKGTDKVYGGWWCQSCK